MRAQFIITAALLLTACGQSDVIKNPLGGKRGDAARGEIIFAARDGGHCVLCHMSETSDAEFQGNLGPDLSAVGARLSPAQLRLRIVDYDRLLPGATMPSYYRTDDLAQVAPEFSGQTLLDEQDIEDIIAYLSALKETSL